MKKKILIGIGIFLLIFIVAGTLGEEEQTTEASSESSEANTALEIDEQVTHAPTPSSAPTTETPEPERTTETIEPIETPTPTEPNNEPTQECHPAYDPCVPPAPPYLNCDDIEGSVTVDHTHSDPHKFDRNKDGVGCEEN